MTLIFKMIGILFCLLVLYVIWQAQELRHFNRTGYQVCSDKLKEVHKWVVLADLHLWRYGRHNERLLQAIREETPEAILIPGDLRS